MTYIKRLICLLSRTCNPFDEKAKKQDPFIQNLRTEQNESMKRINFMEEALEKGRE